MFRKTFFIIFLSISSLIMNMDFFDTQEQTCSNQLLTFTNLKLHQQKLRESGKTIDNGFKKQSISEISLPRSKHSLLLPGQSFNFSKDRFDHEVVLNCEIDFEFIKKTQAHKVLFFLSNSQNLFNRMRNWHGNNKNEDSYLELEAELLSKIKNYCGTQKFIKLEELMISYREEQSQNSRCCCSGKHYEKLQKVQESCKETFEVVEQFSNQLLRSVASKID